MWSAVSEVAIFFLGIIGLGTVALRGKRDLISALILGQIFVYLIWLVSLDVRFCFIVLKFASILGVWALLTSGQLIRFAGVFAFLGSVFLARPMENWDERFVWGFNAKVLHTFTGGAIADQLTRPEIAIFHPNNPKLFSALAAIATSQREWAAYFPKLAMIALWLPIFLLIFKLGLSLWRQSFILLLALTCCGRLVFTAYLDPVLAMGVFIGTYALFFDSRVRRESILLLSLAPLIKLEGALILAIVLGVYAYTLWREGRFRREWKSALWFAPAALAVVLWKWRCTSWGLGSYYTSAQNSFIANLIPRATDPYQYWVVLRSMIQSNRILFDLVLIAGAYRFWGPKVEWRPLRPVLWIGTLNLLCLFPIYFGTPFEMAWHINHSVERTTLPFYLLVVGTLVLGLNPNTFAGGSERPARETQKS